jgi:hypothetical protein
MNGKLYIKKSFPIESNSGITFFSGDSATGNFSRKIFSPSGPSGSNDTGLKTVVLPGAESIAVRTDRPTFFGYYNIDIVSIVNYLQLFQK